MDTATVSRRTVVRACTGKTALVTSASAGVGRAVATALGEAGAQVLVHHTRSPAAAERTAERIQATGGRAKTVAVDLTDPRGPRDLAQRVRAVIGDRLDILVFNARLSKPASLESATVAAFDTEFAANVRAPLFLVQELLPVMGQGSRLVFTMAPTLGARRDPAFSALRGGLEGLADRLAPLVAERGIRVDTLLPDAADEGAGEVDEDAARAAGRDDRPADIARAVTALVSSQA